MQAKKIFMAILMGLLIHPGASFGLSVLETDQKLMSMEDELLIAGEHIRELNAQLNNQMRISGYADAEYQLSSQPGQQPGFRLHHLSLFFEKNLRNKWRFFSEIEYEDAPKFESDGSKIDIDGDGDVYSFESANGKIFLEAVNVSYLWRPSVNFRIGRFYTPSGIWSVNHYPPFVPTQQRPQHIREIFPQLVDGAMTFGTIKLAGSFFNYDLYTGNGEGNTGSHDENATKAVGLNTSFRFPLFNHFTIGTTVYFDKLNEGTEKLVAGAFAKAKIYGFTVQSEFAEATLKPGDGSSSYKQTGYYAQLLYDTGDWTIGIRHDYYHEDNRVPKSGIVYNSLLVNYFINEAIVLKLEHHLVDNENSTSRDYSLSIASIVVYLGN